MELKFRKDLGAQVIIQLDEANVTLDDCRVYGVTEDGRVTIQLQDPRVKGRKVQITLYETSEKPEPQAED